MSLQEITGMEGDVVSMQEIFTLERKGLDAEGRQRVELTATGIRPRFAEHLRASGVELSPGIFEPATRAGY
jgi:pilus assembly protein CpaF